MSTSASARTNLREEVRRALTAPSAPADRSNSTTSDLSIDEELNLHSIGWEPVELVSGVSLHSIPYGYWNWGQGEIVAASSAHATALAHAKARLVREAAAAGGHGVVGVHIERAIHPTHVEVSLVGTAVRPADLNVRRQRDVFASDLSARDFTMLMVAGWEPLGLATGASFVFAPRRSMSTALQQQSQNVELTNFTEAMYSAREAAMQRMQDMALEMHGTGVVAVTVQEGPMSFASHAVGFVALGTVVRLATPTHQLIHPTMVVSLNDATVAFDAQTLG
ncbi:MAG: heavy metal-binding domain-containing protein [Actinomycetota bacterium]|nr:heavy metal-binding domain-containing protein [Actinomycetota bacterium]